MSKVYVSGPMSGYVDYNRPAFHAAAARLVEQGFEVVNPAALDEAENIAGWQHKDFMRRDLRLLLDCDLIYMLPGWRWSKGAGVEHQVALTCGIEELFDTNVEIWRTFEGEVEPGQEALRYGVPKDLPPQAPRTAPPSRGRAEDPAGHPRFGLPVPVEPTERPRPAEDYHLAEITVPAEGDEFPNVGYVRRFARVLTNRAHQEGSRRSA